MYGDNPIGPAAVVPVVTAAGTAAMLPETGASSVTSIAAALFAGLIAWGVVYYYRTVRG